MKISNVVSAIVIVLCLGFIGVMLYGIKPYVVLSGSMEPEIQTGSICFIDTNALYEDVIVGDVIAYQMGGGLVTHRAIGISEVGIETKGDNNDISDGISTTKANFYGKTICSIPYLGYCISFIKQPLVLSSLGILFVLINVICFIRKDNED